MSAAAPVPASPATPIHAHVAVVRIASFATRAAADQANLKERVEDAVLQATAAIPSRDRIVLDTDDGLALVLFCEAEEALDVAQAIRAKAGDADVQVGLNHGPLAATSQGREARVLGDGISAAAAAARFAERDRVLVTEDFANVLRATSPDRARELASAGDFTDTRVRMHKFYAPDPELRAARLRRLALYAGAGVIVILLLGVIGRDIYQPLFQSRPAIVKLEVKPRAEVYVDGVLKGEVPPLTELELPPGNRRIVFKAPGYKTSEVMQEYKPGQRSTITLGLQRLPTPPSKARPQPAPAPDFWRDLKKKFGT